MMAEPGQPGVKGESQSAADQLFERAFQARQKAEEFAGGRRIVRDRTGLYVLEGGKIFP